MYLYTYTHVEKKNWPRAILKFSLRIVKELQIKKMQKKEKNQYQNSIHKFRLY